MFTIKQVLLSGEECYWEATTVRMGKAPNGPQNYDDRTMFFDMPQPNGETIVGSIDRGTVYIMNSHGKTIDRYTLGNPEVKPAGIEAFEVVCDQPAVVQTPGPVEIPDPLKGVPFSELLSKLPRNGVEGSELFPNPGTFLVGAPLVGDPGDEDDREVPPDSGYRLRHRDLAKHAAQIDLSRDRDSRPDLLRVARETRPFNFYTGQRMPGSSGDTVDPALLPVGTCEAGGVRMGSVYLSDAEAEAAANSDRVGPLG